MRLVCRATYLPMQRPQQQCRRALNFEVQTSTYVLQTFTSLHPGAMHWDVPTKTFYLWSTIVKRCNVIFQSCFKCPIKVVEPRLTLVVSHYACRRTSVMRVCLGDRFVYGGWFMSMNSTCSKWEKLSFPSGSTMISADHFDCQWF